MRPLASPNETHTGYVCGEIKGGKKVSWLSAMTEQNSQPTQKLNLLASAYWE